MVILWNSIGDIWIYLLFVEIQLDRDCIRRKVIIIHADATSLYLS